MEAILVEPILAEIREVDFKEKTALFEIPENAEIVAGHYWLVPKGNYVIVHKDALVDGGVKWIG